MTRIERYRPEVFIWRKMGANVFMDTGELTRAQWFWERQPKKLLLSAEGVLKILIFYGGFWLVAKCLNQQALETTALVSTGSTLVIAMPLWAYIVLPGGARTIGAQSLGFVKRFIANGVLPNGVSSRGHLAVQYAATQDPCSDRVLK